MTLAQEIEQEHNRYADSTWMDGQQAIQILVFGAMRCVLDWQLDKARASLLNLAGGVAAKPAEINLWKNCGKHQLGSGGWANASGFATHAITATTIGKILETNDLEQWERLIGIALAEIEHIQSLQK